MIVAISNNLSDLRSAASGHVHRYSPRERVGISSGVAEGAGLSSGLSSSANPPSNSGHVVQTPPPKRSATASSISLSLMLTVDMHRLAIRCREQAPDWLRAVPLLKQRRSTARRGSSLVTIATDPPEPTTDLRFRRDCLGTNLDRFCRAEELTG